MKACFDLDLEGDPSVGRKTKASFLAISASIFPATLRIGFLKSLLDSALGLVRREPTLLLSTDCNTLVIAWFGGGLIGVTQTGFFGEAGEFLCNN